MPLGEFEQYLYEQPLSDWRVCDFSREICEMLGNVMNEPVGSEAAWALAILSEVPLLKAGLKDPQVTVFDILRLAKQVQHEVWLACEPGYEHQERLTILISEWVRQQLGETDDFMPMYVNRAGEVDFGQ